MATVGRMEVVSDLESIGVDLGKAETTALAAMMLRDAWKAIVLNLMRYM